MIVSKEYKFVFIGLPFSASSAITRDLCNNYAGKPRLAKHSLYHEFKKTAQKKELDYLVFAVLRNPMEIVISSYQKMKTNKKGNLDNPKLFKENGGHISKKQRKHYNYIKRNNATFQEYFLKFYKKPYDNMASLTLHECDEIIRYENIQRDYIAILKKVGVKSPKPLSEANKTAGKKQNLSFYYTKDIKERAIYVFGPFLEKYKYKFPEEWGKIHVSIFSRFYFNFLYYLRKIYIVFFKKPRTTKSIKESIYGRIQRKI